MRHIYIPLAGLAFLTTLAAQGRVVQGIVTDAVSGEPVIGASVKAPRSLTVTDIDGRFSIDVQGRGPLHITMISYAAIDTLLTGEETLPLVLTMTPSQEVLQQVEVTGVKRRRSDRVAVQELRESHQLAVGVGAESITRSQDRDAGEVVRRLPGISLIDDRYIVARGLSQRYNNVWVNDAPMPSSEADSRAFSFDVIPTGQIENVMVYKSPAPEIPADFTGGFVKIATRDTPESQPFNISFSMGGNTQSTFGKFLYNPGSATDWLGFDNGHRALLHGLGTHYENGDPVFVEEMTRRGFNNDWSIHQRHAMPDLKGNASWGRDWQVAQGRLTLNTALNYSHTQRTLDNMDNSRYGIYNIALDRPEYLYHYTDDQYQSTARWGAMANVSWLRGDTRISLRNIFNQIGQSRLTERRGWQNISSLYHQEKTEYIFTSRSSYCGQLSGQHKIGEGFLNWEGSYTYANKHQPDRRIINRQENDMVGDAHQGQMMVDQNDIQRSYMTLDEHMASLGADWRMPVIIGDTKTEIKAGAFGQYRCRRYDQRSFYYRYMPWQLPEDFPYRDPVTEILIPENYGYDKLYVYDDTDNRDSYRGHDLQWAAYASWDLPLDPVDVYAGVRLEQSRMTLTSYTYIYQQDTEDRHYNTLNVFPSVNATYHIDAKQQLRLAYGMSTNRPEFREVSPSVYYDFELFSDIKGNPDLNAALVHNLDLRWEWYPQGGEMVTFGAFYKHFANPIENTFIDAGGSYTYTFENAHSAWAFGLETEVRKSLDFIHAPWLTLTLNAAYIHSRVNFDATSLEHNRPMQGQSPYIINAGLYYIDANCPLTGGVVYNRIGKRIVGIGRSDMSVGGSINNDIPDMYEMPRDMLDVVATWNLSSHYTLSVAAKDILGQKLEFAQFPKYQDASGHVTQRRQICRSFSPGTNLSLTFTAKF